MSYQNQDQEDKNSCPFCGSPDWKMASLVYLEGISTTVGETNSSGIGVSTGGLGAGASKGQINATTQSSLSLRAAPPEDPVRSYTLKIALVLGIISFLIQLVREDLLGAVLLTGLGMMVLFPISILLAYLYVNFFSDVKKEYERSVRDWSKVKMCLRCGLFFNK